MFSFSASIRTATRAARSSTKFNTATLIGARNGSAGSVNRVTLIGDVVKDDPMITALQKHYQSEVTFNVTTSSLEFNRLGLKEERKQKHQIVSYDLEINEKVAREVKKGCKVYVSGSIDYARRMKPDGKPVHMMVITPHDVEVVEPPMPQPAENAQGVKQDDVEVVEPPMPQPAENAQGVKQVNRVTLVGNVGKDPSITGMLHHESDATFGLATNSVVFDYLGNGDKKPQWHRIMSSDPVINEKIAREVKKGCKVYVSGAINYARYMSRDGTYAYIPTIVPDDVEVVAPPMPKPAQD